MTKPISAGEREIYQQLEITGPKSCNELARTMGITVKEVVAQLAQMELRGVVAEDRGVWKINS